MRYVALAVTLAVAFSVAPVSAKVIRVNPGDSCNP